MRTLVLLGIIASFLFALPAPGGAEPIKLETLYRIADKFPFYYVLERKGEPARFIYADWGRYIRVFKIVKDRAELEWESPVLGSQVSSLVVRDVNNDGIEEIIVSTYKGRIVGWETKTFELVGENLLEPFKDVTCMAIENLDKRGGIDIVFIAEGLLNIYDLLTRQRIWRSDKPYAASEMLLANVDDDPQLEIILNSGYIVDSRFYREELFYQEGFGRRMTLLDINGDGHPEIIGETTTQALLIFDIYGEREMFPRW
jgi:hypothetical protein